MASNGGFPRGSVVKDHLQCRRPGLISLQVGKIPWRRKWQPTPVFCLGNPVDRGTWQAAVHGVSKELDMTQRLNNDSSKQVMEPWFPLSSSYSASPADVPSVTLTTLHLVKQLTSLIRCLHGYVIANFGFGYWYIYAHIYMYWYVFEFEGFFFNEKSFIYLFGCTKS